MASTSGATNFTQHEAKQLFEHGGTLVFLDVPQGTEFGIDYNTWNVGPNFKGVKMIPPGVHFVYYSAVSKEKQAAPRTGFFHNFQAKEVLIKKWNNADEDISMVPTSPEEQAQIEENKQDMDRFLGVYPYEHYERWISLTDHITPDLVQHLQPSSGKICAVAQFQSELSTSQSRKEAADREKEAAEHQKEAGGNQEGAESGAALMEESDSKLLDSDGLPNMKKTPGTDFNFSKIPLKKYPDGATASEISQYSMDYSYVFENILNTTYKEREMGLLGELQFAFVCFILAQVYEGFEQWKTLVNLFSFTENAIQRHPELFSKLIAVLHFQIREVPEDFFVDIVAQNNFLVGNLRQFFCNVDECGVASLKERALRFKKHLEKKFKWDLSFEEDDEEDAPVIVDLD